MKRIAISLLLAPAVLAGATAGEFTRYVNPFIGTGPVDGGLSGNNYPGATAPFGMIQLSPDTNPVPDWYNASGYDYNDSKIYGFSHTRLSGTGASDLIDILFFPTVADRRESSFSHDREEARPGYYSVMLDDEGIKAELTAGRRAAMHRYTYPSGGDARLLIDLDHSAQKGSWDRKIINSQIRVVNDSTVEGYRVITGWAKLRRVYFTAVFNHPIVKAELSDGATTRLGATVVNGRELKAMLDFGHISTPLEAKVGISPVSYVNARGNLRSEVAQGFGFDDLAARTDAQWDEHLGRIEVEGGTPEEREMFYTALYHTMIQPNLFSDVNGAYVGPDYAEKQLAGGEEQYTTFSLWDTYRAAHPLYTIIEPQLTADFVNSMLRHYRDYGYLPIWHLWGQDNYCMIGNHAIPVVVDAVLKGIPGIDAEAAYEAVKGSSLQPHPGSPFDIYEELGYMPEDKQSQSVSITLEEAFDDWCVARLAEKLGKEEDCARFDSRARNYANLYNPSTGFFQGRNSDGSWVEPFDPLRHGANGGYPYTEGNAWQYFWYLPHDIPALAEYCGGKKGMEAKLDRFFTLTDTSGAKNDNISGEIGQYAHGNEPSHHVAYLYNDCGAPRKARELIHHIITNLYTTAHSGYAGNDDCGEMSSWYVFSAMGFYPVNPASGEYYLGTPTFDRCTIHMADGKDFVVEAKRRRQGDYQVKDVTLDGRKLSPTGRLRHTDITSGSTLTFNLGK